jgi:hypothetical protein
MALETIILPVCLRLNFPTMLKMQAFSKYTYVEVIPLNPEVISSLSVKGEVNKSYE